MKKRLRELLEAAVEAGARVEWTRNNHLRIRCPKGVVHTGSTPSCHRGILNLRAQLRRAGLKELER